MKKPKNLQRIQRDDLEGSPRSPNQQSAEETSVASPREESTPSGSRRGGSKRLSSGSRRATPRQAAGTPQHADEGESPRGKGKRSGETELTVLTKRSSTSSISSLDPHYRNLYGVSNGESQTEVEHALKLKSPHVGSNTDGANLSIISVESIDTDTDTDSKASGSLVVPAVTGLESVQSNQALNETRSFRFDKDDVRTAHLTMKVRRRLAAEAEMMIHGTEEELGFKLAKADITSMFEDRSVDQFKKYGQAAGIAKLVKSDAEKGLTENAEEELTRIKCYGLNIYPKPFRKTLLDLFMDNLNDPMLIILSIAAFVKIIIGATLEADELGYVEGIAIAAAVILVSGFTAISDYSREKQFRSLNDVKNDRLVRVRRNGKPQQISVFDLKVGDVALLDGGDQIPADGVFIEGYSLKCDESAMTGESDVIEKSLSSPFLLSGCQVVEGIGAMLVLRIGVQSEWGKTLKELSMEHKETPLQEKLGKLALLIGKFGLYAAVLTFSVQTTIWAIQKYGVDDESYAWGDLEDILDFFINAITIIVVAIPEGLPLAVTLSLAYSLRRMMKDHNLVRHLEACETMGGATNICSDKTGTLTENRMSVVEGVFFAEKFSKVPSAKNLHAKRLDILSMCCAVNSNAEVELGVNDTLRYVGSKTEGALLVMCELLNHNASQIRAPHRFIYRKLRDRSHPYLRVYTFSSDRKRMSTVVRCSTGARLLCKGAAEIVLDQCTDYIAANGEQKSLNQAERVMFQEHIRQMASKGLRAISLAYRDIPKDDWNAIADSKEAPEDSLALLAIVGIKDPLRPEVKDAVRGCKDAGITVRMVTGDNKLTAEFIARECGILTNGMVVEGPEFRRWSDAEVDRVLDRIQVMARSSPSDKHRLVSRLRAKGEVVAVTGDGTNDAPALKEADIGLAMGISGTEVAKEASDVIILDDNFASIVKTVMWGRNVYDSIRKFVQFQLTVNVVAVALTFVAAATSQDIVSVDGAPVELPLKPVHLLWVNLIMDTLGALALATERPSPLVLSRPPHGREDKLISKKMWRNIFIQSSFQLAVLLFLLFADYNSALENDDIQKRTEERNTIIFNTFVFFQVFNECNARRINDELNVFEGITKHAKFIVIMFSIVIIQIIFVQVDAISSGIDLVPLTAVEWAFCLGVASLSLPIGLLARMYGQHVDGDAKK